MLERHGDVSVWAILQRGMQSYCQTALCGMPRMYKQVLEEAKHRGHLVRLVDYLMVRQLVCLASASVALVSSALCPMGESTDRLSKVVQPPSALIQDGYQHVGISSCRIAYALLPLLPSSNQDCHAKYLADV